MNNKVSVIIPISKNTDLKKIHNCLDSLEKQKLKPKEIIISGYDINKFDELKKKYQNIRYIKQSTDFGITGAKNAAILDCDKNSDYLVFINSNVTADKKMIYSLVNSANKSDSIGIVTPVLYYKTKAKHFVYFGLHINTLLGKISLNNSSTPNVNSVSDVMCVKRDLIDKIGGFDQKYYEYFEDIDFCFNAQSAGYKIIVSERATAEVTEPKYLNIKKILECNPYLYERNKIYFLGKHGKSFNVNMILVLLMAFIDLTFLMTKKNNNAITKYLNAFKDGLIKEVLVKRLMIFIPYSRLNILRKVLGAEKATVLDVGCGNGELMEILNRKKLWKMDGIDIYPIDAGLARTTGVYRQVKVGDIRKVRKYFPRKEYDIVFCSQVLEHLEKKDACILMREMEKIGRKIVFSTPRGFLKKDEPHDYEGDNPYQIHRSAWSIEDYQEKGYRVFGNGASFLFGDAGLLDRRKKYPKILDYLGQGLSLFLQPLVFYYPKYSTGLLAVKFINNK